MMNFCLVLATTLLVGNGVVAHWTPIFDTSNPHYFTVTGNRITPEAHHPHSQPVSPPYSYNIRLDRGLNSNQMLNLNPQISVPLNNGPVEYVVQPRSHLWRRFWPNHRLPLRKRSNNDAESELMAATNQQTKSSDTDLTMAPGFKGEMNIKWSVIPVYAPSRALFKDRVAFKRSRNWTPNYLSSSHHHHHHHHHQDNVASELMFWSSKALLDEEWQFNNDEGDESTMLKRNRRQIGTINWNMLNGSMRKLFTNATGLVDDIFGRQMSRRLRNSMKVASKTMSGVLRTVQNNWKRISSNRSPGSPSSVTTGRLGAKWSRAASTSSATAAGS